MNDQLQLVSVPELPAAEITPIAHEMAKAALESAALIARVANDTEQAAAVAAQTEIYRVVKLWGKAEDLAKKPLNTVRNQIITMGKKFLAPLDEENSRIAAMVGEYQEKERARAAAEQRAADEKYSDLERQKNAELAKATTLEQQDEINEKYSRMAQDIEMPAAPARVAGQVISCEWNVEVTDIWMLARAHPT